MSSVDVRPRPRADVLAQLWQRSEISGGGCSVDRLGLRGDLMVALHVASLALQRPGGVEQGLGGSWPGSSRWWWWQLGAAESGRPLSVFKPRSSTPSRDWPWLSLFGCRLPRWSRCGDLARCGEEVGGGASFGGWWLGVHLLGPSTYPWRARPLPGVAAAFLPAYAFSVASGWPASHPRHPGPHAPGPSHRVT